MNYKIINILWFLTVLFCVAALRKYDTRKRAMAAADQKSVCGLRYCGSRVRTKNRNLIEKMVSE
jgi:hypothetical protein